MDKKLSGISILCLIGAAGLLIISIFLPWWGMKFYAPQYPEGLDIIVYPTKLDGDIDIVNGLNHYIGMAPFSEASFPELQYIPYIVVGMAVLIIITALIRKRLLVYGLIALFSIGGAVGIFDMYHWLKKFGTELDPMAPIDLEPFIPPIIGENTIANFVTHSYFAYGAYVLLAVLILMIVPLWKDRKQ